MSRVFSTSLPDELHVLAADPKQIRNLVDDPDRASILAESRSELEDWQRRTDVPRRDRDGISLCVIPHHLDAGMTIPDRFDSDVQVPGSS